MKLITIYRQAFANLQRNIWILSIASFINRSGSIVLLFTSLYLTKELNFTIPQAGIILSFYGLGSILGSYTGGWLTDRISYNKIMLFSLISCGLILLLLLTTTSPTFIAIIIFAYAFTADMFRPANSVAMVAYSTPENRTRSVSLMRLAVNFGLALGPATGGFIAIRLGYHWLFVLDSLTSFAAAAMLFFYLPKGITEKNRHKSEVLQDSSTSAYRDLEYLVFIFLVAVWGTCFFQILASVPQYFNRVCNYKEDTIGLLMGLNGMLVVVIEMPLVTALEKRKLIFPYIIAGSGFLAFSFVALLFGNGLMFASISFIFLITLSEIFAMPFIMNHAMSRPLKERQGQYTALYAIAFGISNIIAPSVGLGIAGKYSFNTLFVCLIALSVISGFGFMMLNRYKKRRDF